MQGGPCPCCGAASGACGSCGAQNHQPSMMLGAISGILGFPAPSGGAAPHARWGEHAAAEPAESEPAGWRSSVLARIRSSEMPSPAFLSSSFSTKTDTSSSYSNPYSVKSSDLAGAAGGRAVTYPPSPPAAAAMRRTPSYCAHPTTGDATLDESINFNLLSGRFSLRGELMHAFVCYRYATDGPEGNGLAGLIAERTRGLSLQGADDLTIPRHGW
ncbi:hypothetical protein T484DRAFT_1870023 [Baffinella frigidus]|nr:hypothetical protein T484DRAFT_1870023 [Cryptophyta sp. CCMP2293]